jgi:hypothetical protein
MIVNIRRLIPGTRRKITQYHGLSIIFKIAKLFKPGMYPCHGVPTPDFLIKAGTKMRCSAHIKPSKIQGIKLIVF